MRLIDADALKQTFCEKCACVGCENCNINFHFAHLAPTVDAEIVRHGHWRRENSRPSSWVWLCSVCGETAYFCNHKKSCSYQYCPNCGAKMDNTNETEVVNFSDGRKLVVPNGAFDSLYYSEDE